MEGGEITLVPTTSLFFSATSASRAREGEGGRESARPGETGSAAEAGPRDETGFQREVRRREGGKATEARACEAGKLLVVYRQCCPLKC